MNPYLVPDDDSEIDLKELLRYILRHWILLLVSGLIFACILGGYKVSKSMGQSAATVEQNETEAEEENLAYTAESEMYVQANDHLRAGTVSQSDYLKNSTLMQLDPYNVPTAEASIIITTKTRDKTIAPMVANELCSDLLGGGYLEDLAEETGVGAVPYLRELVTISVEPLTESGILDMAGNSGSSQASDSSQSVTVEASGESQDDSSNITRYEIQVKAVGKDQDQAESILDGVLAEAETYGKTLAETYKFEALTTEKRNYRATNGNILVSQQGFFNSWYWAKDMVGKVKANQDALEKPASVATATATGLAAVDKKSLVKYAGLGFVVGVFLMALYYLLRYLRNDKLVSYKDLCTRFILKDMGTYDQTPASVHMIAANLLNYARDAKKILLVGTVGDEILENLRSALGSQNPDHTILAGGNLLTTAEARRGLTDADAVILVEKQGVSKYSEIARETEILSNAEKPIAGIIIC